MSTMFRINTVFYLFIFLLQDEDAHEEETTEKEDAEEGEEGIYWLLKFIQSFICNC